MIIPSFINDNSFPPYCCGEAKFKFLSLSAADFYYSGILIVSIALLIRPITSSFGKSSVISNM